MSKNTTCSIEGCEKREAARSWCHMHYKRWQKNGDPTNPGNRELFLNPEDAFAARTRRDGDCLTWTGSKDAKGYGRMSISGRLVGVHRFAWERENGPIPDGMQIDHTCWNRACANTEHLRLATNQENRSSLSGAINGRALPRGVWKSGKRYAAKVVRKGVPYYLGLHDTPEEASRAASAKRAELFGEFAGRS